MKLTSILALGLALLVTACGDDKDTLKVGTISGPETDLMATVKEVAAKEYGLKIKNIVFNDYALPNTALSDGSIDANIFQHIPYLRAANTARGYDLVSVAQTFIFPMGIYSKKHQSLKDLPSGAIIAIPNDPTNEARALKLLATSGLIQLAQANDFITTRDIKSNPKQLVFKTLDAAQLARVLPDVDFAVINTNFAVPAGLSPSRDAIVVETNDSEYANIIVVRANEKDDLRIQQLVKSYQSAAVAAKAQKMFGDDVIVTWKNGSPSKAAR